MKRIVVIIGLAIILLTIPIMIFMIGQQQELRSKAAPATSVSITPSTQTVKPGDPFTLTVQVNTGGNQIKYIEPHIQFDSQYLKATSITNNSTLFPRIFIQGQIGSGTASIGVGIPGDLQPFTGSGAVAVIHMEAIKGSTTPVSVSLTAESQATALDENTNTIIDRKPATITITGGAAAATDTPTSSPSPSPTPIAAAATSPTPITSVTATPSPTPVLGQGGGTATPSSFAITFPPDGALLDSTRPLFSGVASPSSSLRLALQPLSLNTTVIASTSGFWEYMPTTALSPGNYVLTVTSTQEGGVPVSLATGFTVNGMTVTNATQSAMPSSGEYDKTILMVTLSILIILAGFMLPGIIRI